MGFRVLLIAVSGKSPTDIHTDYGVVPTGECDEVPDAPVSGASLPSGRYLLFINDRILPEDRILAKLSRNANLIACYANETVMNSFTSAWIDGVESWSVFHDAQQGVRHLETSGSLPDCFASIRDRIVAEQDGAGDDCGVDYIYDVPVDLFAELGGIATTRTFRMRQQGRGRYCAALPNKRFNPTWAAPAITTPRWNWPTRVNLGVRQ